MPALMSSPVPTDPERTLDGNVDSERHSRNPLARLLVTNFTTTLRHLVWCTGAREIHEIGRGAGPVSLLLAGDGLRVRSSDLLPAAVGDASPRVAARDLAIPFRGADLYALAPDRDGAELVVCCEVLEHLPDPVRALQTLAGLARPYLIVSAPREPLWRLLNLARGRYWRDLGNTPGHLQHWSTPGFVALLQERLDVVELCTPLPWTMALCRAR